MRANVTDWRSDDVSSSAAPPGVAPERPVAPVAAAPIVAERAFSLAATFLGWSVAAFFTMVLSAAIAAVLGAQGVTRPLDLNRIGFASLVGYLVVAFAAYAIGGYTAGRLAPSNGMRHGMLTVAWAAGFGLLAIILTAALADAYDVGAYIPTVTGTVTLGTVLSILATLASMLGGAAVGGMLGERYHDRALGIAPRERRLTRSRGRPL